MVGWIDCLSRSRTRLGLVIWILVAVNTGFPTGASTGPSKPCTLFASCCRFMQVVRDGADQSIPAGEITQVMYILAEGDNIPADARIVKPTASVPTTPS
jgi:hypothetical protein